MGTSPCQGQDVVQYCPERQHQLQNDQVQNPKRHDLEDDVAHHESPRSSTCQANTPSDAQPTIEEPYLEMTPPMFVHHATSKA